MRRKARSSRVGRIRGRLVPAGFAVLAACLSTACVAPPSQRSVDAPEMSERQIAIGLGRTHQMTVAVPRGVAWGLRETGARTGRPEYPLGVSEDGRYLVDQRGRPWRIQADAAWLMSSDATPEQVDDYLARRHAQGFNSFYLMAMVHPGGYRDAAPNAPNDRLGHPPFAKEGDFATVAASPESALYWDWIDSIIDKAAAHDMVVMLAYTYLGYGGGDMGWYEDVLRQPSRRALYDWGVWLGRREQLPRQPDLVRAR